MRAWMLPSRCVCLCVLVSLCDLIAFENFDETFDSVIKLLTYVCCLPPPSSSSTNSWSVLIFSITYDKSCLIFKIILHYLFIRACNSSVSMNIKFIDLFIATRDTIFFTQFLFRCYLFFSVYSWKYRCKYRCIYMFLYIFVVVSTNAVTFMTAYLFQVVLLFVSHLSSILCAALSTGFAIYLFT